MSDDERRGAGDAIERLEADIPDEAEIHGPEFMADLRTVLALARRVAGLEWALRRTHSRLSLIRHRYGINWDTPGDPGLIGTAVECDEILGLAEAALRDAHPTPREGGAHNAPERAQEGREGP